MKRIITITLFIFALCQSRAQQIDNTILKCVYHYEYMSRVKRPDLLPDTMMLEIGSKSCKFYSFYNHTIYSEMKNSDPGTWMSFPKRTENKYKIYTN